MKSTFMKRCGPAAVLCILAFGCATVNLNALPEPSPTARLRVYVHALTASGKWKWGTPHEIFVTHQIRRVEEYLERTGIYEVVKEEDVRAVLGGQTVSREQMERDDWRLARETAKAFHADYVMVIERSKERGTTGQVNWYFTSILINRESGRSYQGRVIVPRVTRSDRRQQVELIKKTYAEIFTNAKEDMLAVAIRKGRALPAITGTAPQPAPVRKAGEAKPVPGPSADDEAVGEAQEEEQAAATTERTLQPLLSTDQTPSGRLKLAVYDLNAPEQYRPAALILSEALREELFRLKQFTLVNRETLQKVLEEIALQQTGLIDEKEAVRTGRGLAANQIVTGQLGTLGKLFVFQAKRTDVETFATLGMASARFGQGEEELILEKLPDLARTLAGLEQGGSGGAAVPVTGP